VVVAVVVFNVVRRIFCSFVVRGLEWELEGKWGGNNGDKVKTKKEGENYHDRHAVLYLGFTLTVLGRHVYSLAIFRCKE